ncbi:exodeoxyribonuclease V subunit alpha [Variovorax sp. ZT4R33]|uniref:exodeoxyribonuclease V subunit alpha n=1 Tax=Variovorax sp. ZT4R33 TaxID=3443743 RepID=UPI003F458384
MTPASLLTVLRQWAESGWLRRLDAAFAGFLHELDPDTSAELLMAGALVAHMEGRGHACLLLDELLDDTDALLGWLADAQAALHAAMASLHTEPAAWSEALQASSLVGTGDASGSAPLVLHEGRLYLRRYWDYERRVAAEVLQRGATPLPVDTAAVRRQLDLLFPVAAKAEESASALDWQKAACGLALRGRFSIITGGPGTGKTYTAARLLALLFAMDASPERLRVMLAAPTGKAAARLKQSIDAALDALNVQVGDRLPLDELASHIQPARTLHSLLGARPDTRRFRFDAAHPLEVDVLIVDEASMIHLEMMAALLEALPPTARVIFLGDKDQLASVEAGAVLGDLCRDAESGRYQPQTLAYLEAVTGQRVPEAFAGDGPPLAQQTVMLRQSHRFGGPIGQLAAAVNQGDATSAVTLLHADRGGALAWLDAPSPVDVVALALRGRPGAPGGFDGYLAALHARPAPGDAQAHADWVLAVLTAFERFRLLCAVRQGEWGAEGLNAAIERAMVAEGSLVKRGAWYEGRPVMITRNDAAVGVFNGDIGITLPPAMPNAPLRAYFLDGNTARSVGVSRLASVETAFAMTVHKSQGSEFEHTVLVLPRDGGRVLTRELVYTGITRARSAFTLVTPRAPAFAQALAQRTHRASGLLSLLGR